MEVEDYRSLSSKIIGISKSYQDGDEVLKFASHIEAKLDSFDPTIMVYGVYNAGKSTLVNALFGKEDMAKTGDAPETSDILEYKYNGFTIYDTPGINAPIEHQKITEKHLRKCELVVFVLSNDGSFEERLIYERIGEIIKSNKPILIAINNKSGIDINSYDAQAEICKVNQHLSSICDEMGIEKAEEKVDIAFVDAKTALEGKVELEEELVEESNISVFEKKIDQMLAGAGKTEVLNALNQYMLNYINSTTSIIDSRLDNPDMKKTQELITTLEKLKQKVYIELKDMAMQSLSIAVQNLFELLLVRDEEQINSMIEKTIKYLNDKIAERIKEVQKELQKHAMKFQIEFEQYCINNVSMPLSIENSKQEESNSNSESFTVKKAVLGSGAIAMVTPPSLVIPTPLGPIPVKPFLMLVSTLFGFFSDSSEARAKAQAKLDQKRAMHLNAKNRSDQFGLDLKEKLNKSIELNIDNTFTTVINNYIDFSQKLENDNKSLIDDKTVLQSIVDRIQVF